MDGNDGLRMISISWLYPFCLRLFLLSICYCGEVLCLLCVLDLLNQSIHSVPRRCTDVQMKDES